MSLSTTCWYISLSNTASSPASSRLWLGSIGVFASLHVNFLVSLRRFVIYFYWEIKILYLDCATLIPKKYFNLPNSLISNSLGKHCLKVFLSFSSFPIMMMLTTYTRKVVTSPEQHALDMLGTRERPQISL